MRWGPDARRLAVTSFLSYLALWPCPALWPCTAASASSLQFRTQTNTIARCSPREPLESGSRGHCVMARRTEARVLVKGRGVRGPPGAHGCAGGGAAADQGQRGPPGGRHHLRLQQPAVQVRPRHLPDLVQHPAPRAQKVKPPLSQATAFARPCAASPPSTCQEETLLQDAF